MQSASRTTRIPLLVGLCFLAAALLVEYMAILVLNHGFFVYTLDDPYIHLALAENILHGHYGVNAGEFSAPSSSILWPFLIAPFSSWEFFPLALNVVFALLTVVVFAKILHASIRTENASGTLVISALLVALILATNLIGLVLTGMEHSLQVLIVTLVAYGLIVEAEEGRVTPWLLAAIIVAPLVRYEDIAVSIAAILYLGIYRHYKSAMTAMLSIIVLLGGFTIFLIGLGLDPFPSSVVVKSTVVQTGGRLHTLMGHLQKSLWNPRGMVLGCGLVGLLGLVLFGKEEGKKWHLAVLVCLAIGMHLVAGEYGWGNRYEIYIFSFMVLISLYIVGGRIETLLCGGFAKSNAWKIVLFSGVSLFLVCEPYIRFLPGMPIASNNIYEQVYQMHRFAVEYYKKPVAVNDIGYVSYKNEGYVLDLYGLASKEAFALKLLHGSSDPEWMDSLAKSKNVGLVMIYPSWFPTVPATWIKAGELHLGKARWASAEDKVAFYALSEDAYGEILPELQSFVKTLPADVTFGFEERKAEGPGDYR